MEPACRLELRWKNRPQRHRHRTKILRTATLLGYNNNPRSILCLATPQICKFSSADSRSQNNSQTIDKRPRFYRHPSLNIVGKPSVKQPRTIAHRSVQAAQALSTSAEADSTYPSQATHSRAFFLRLERTFSQTPNALHAPLLSRALLGKYVCDEASGH